MQLKYKSVNKSLARLIMVQAIYSHEINNKYALPRMTNELLDYYNQDDLLVEYDLLSDDYQIVKADQNLLEAITELYQINMVKIDQLIAGFLTKSWQLKDISSIVRIILRCAICELKYYNKTPIKVIIDEYTSLASLFYGKAETGFVNSILDKICGNLIINQD